MCFLLNTELINVPIGIRVAIKGIVNHIVAIAFDILSIGTCELSVVSTIVFIILLLIVIIKIFFVHINNIFELKKIVTMSRWSYCCCCYSVESLYYQTYRYGQWLKYRWFDHKSYDESLTCFQTYRYDLWLKY